MEAGVMSVATGLRVILSQRHHSRAIYSLASRKYCSSGVNTYTDGDPAPVFFNERVQSQLQKLTGEDYNKLFRKRLNEKRLEAPKYEFLTSEELEERMNEVREKAKNLLQMPPVVKERKPIEEVLSRDPAISGHDTATYIFTDISFGVSDRERIIVVRDPDGTLRQASWDERDRMNALYNPQPGRKLITPKMFEEDNLSEVLKRGEFEFVLDKACAQFEPDDPVYQRVASAVYEAVDAQRRYQELQSTRHFGPLCFYLAWNKKIDNFLLTLVRLELIPHCIHMIQLYHLIHQDCKSAKLNVDPEQHLDFIKRYVEHDSLQRPKLELALQSYQELLQGRQQYQQDVKAAHGL